MDKIAIVTFPRNLDIAGKIKEFTGGKIILYSEDAFKEAFEYDAIIAIMAAGIVVRNIAPLIKDKWSDPAVVVIDPGLKFAVPILGGHHGGNDMAIKLSGMGIIPVLTTATEVAGKESVEKLAESLGCKIKNRASTKKVNMKLLEEDVEVLRIRGPKIVIVDNDVSVMERYGLIVGIGANSGVSASEVRDAVMRALAMIDVCIDDVKLFASASIKENEKGIIDAAEAFGKEINFVPSELINSMHSPSPSKARALGLNGVCEPAALALSEQKELLLKKRIFGNVTIAIAR